MSAAEDYGSLMKDKADCGCGRTCSVDGCEKPHEAHGFCQMHYRRWKASGDPGPAGPVIVRGVPTEERVWPRVDKDGPGGCWLWTGPLQPKGYARVMQTGGAAIMVHRFVYELLVGPVPDGLQLDHLCRVRHCCNPAHLEPVTNAENQHRGMAPPGLHFRATHCKRGHEFTEENTYRRPSKADVRECLICLRERNNRYQKARKRG